MNIAVLADETTQIETAPERLISIPFLLLRAATAGGALATGFVQTFVFARVLTPERFSIFIVAAAIGYTLWLCDLGLAKIVFVKLRSAHLDAKPDQQTAREATAVILFHTLLAVVASLVCFTIAFLQLSFTIKDAADLALFFLFITLNLVWFSLRGMSIAVDLYLFYERLELTRRVITITTLFALLGGLPITTFLVASNALWGAFIGTAVARLIRRGAMAPRLRGFARDLLSFFRLNRHSIARSSTNSLSAVLISIFPYYVVPLMYGLGEAPIILEVTFRIFRGTYVIYSSATDLVIAEQTRALAARDAGRLIRATMIAIGLCCIPAACVCAVLIFAGGPFFAFLLRSAATVPPAITPILVTLVLANIAHLVSESLLQYTGFFRSLARVNALVAVMMIVITAVSIAAKFDIVGFLGSYAAVYAAGAVLLAIAAVRGPIRTAAVHGGEKRPLSDILSVVPDAGQTPSA